MNQVLKADLVAGARNTSRVVRHAARAVLVSRTKRPVRTSRREHHMAAATSSAGSGQREADDHGFATTDARSDAAAEGRMPARDPVCLRRAMLMLTSVVVLGMHRCLQELTFLLWL
jgi:hypothetical protein